MRRATKALAALAALAASASAAHPAAVPQAAPVNCSRHIRVGVFDDANPLAASFLTGWMDDEATACYSFHHMSTGNRAIELLAIARWGYITRNNLVTTREKLYELETDRIESGGANLVLNTLQYFARANYDYRYRPRPRPGEPEGGSEKPPPRGILPDVGREPGCVIYIYVQLGP